MEEKRKIEIIAPLAGFFILVVLLHLSGISIPLIIYQQSIEPITQVNEPFAGFALLVNFLYEIIPQTAQHFASIGAISTILLIRGFNPIAFGIVIALGKLVGQYTLYFVSRYGFHGRKKDLGGLASAKHFLHKYHSLVFLMAPWTGIGGDALMVLAGQQRINPVKILPILAITDLAEAYYWIFMTLGQLELEGILTQ